MHIGDGTQANDVLVEFALAGRSEQQYCVVGRALADVADHLGPMPFGPVLGVAGTVAPPAAHRPLVAGLYQMERACPQARGAASHAARSVRHCGSTSITGACGLSWSIAAGAASEALRRHVGESRPALDEMLMRLEGCRARPARGIVEPGLCAARHRPPVAITKPDRALPAFLQLRAMRCLAKLSQ